MTYSVETSGQLLLPEELEKQALTVLEVELVSRQGRFDTAAHVDTLAELAAYAGAQVRRDGDWLHVATSPEGDREWSDQATAFYVGLARFVREGEVSLQGADGARWSYRYGPDGVIQVGQNGWTGRSSPSARPSKRGGPRRPLPPRPTQRTRPTRPTLGRTRRPATAPSP